MTFLKTESEVNFCQDTSHGTKLHNNSGVSQKHELVFFCSKNQNERFSLGAPKDEMLSSMISTVTHVGTGHKLDIWTLSPKGEERFAKQNVSNRCFIRFRTRMSFAYSSLTRIQLKCPSMDRPELLGWFSPVFFFFFCWKDSAHGYKQTRPTVDLAVVSSPSMRPQGRCGAKEQTTIPQTRRHPTGHFISQYFAITK